MPFSMDDRLGIEIPNLNIPFEELPPALQEDILVQWEQIRARIPDQIMKFEHVIETRLQRIHQEDDWDAITAHFDEITEYASRIAELNTWQRTDPTLPSAMIATTREHHDREK